VVGVGCGRGAAVSAVVPRGVRHLVGDHVEWNTKATLFWTWERFELCYIERSNPRADILACARGPRHGNVRSSSQLLARFHAQGSQTPSPVPHRWRGFAFDAPEQLGSSCVRQSNPSGFSYRHADRVHEPRRKRDLRRRGSAFWNSTRPEEAAHESALRRSATGLLATTEEAVSNPSVNYYRVSLS
jgi:hypothetical protein